MKIVLVFSPFVEPTYIPIGIAQLKSYVEKQIPSAYIRTLDFNNTFFNNLTKKYFWNHYKELCEICPKNDKNHRCDRQVYFTGGQESYTFGAHCAHDAEGERFYDLTTYNLFVQEITRSFTCWNDCFSAVAKDVIEDKCPVPVALEKMLEPYVQRILSEKPDLVGFSIFCGMQLSYSLLLARILREKTGLPIIFGGAVMAHVNVCEFLEVFDYVDFALAKEGEIGLGELARNFKNKKFEKVPGLFYRKKNKIYHNAEKYLEDLDNLPFPDFDDYDLQHYFSPVPVLPLISSRGCYWRNCTFCSYSKSYPRPYKIKSIPRLIEELRYFSSRGIKYFMIDDDIISATHLCAISNALTKEKIKVYFGAITRPEKSFSHEALECIYRAGGRLLLWGVESNNERILQLMQKGTHSDDIELLLQNAAQIGFTNHCFMIVGFPTQTVQEIANDLRFLLKNKDVVSFHLHGFLLKKGSYIFNNLQEFGIVATEETPVFTRHKKSFYDDSVMFKSSLKLDWKKIKTACEQLERLFLNNRFQNTGHAHALILASKNKKVML
ncbi:MAG: radical SAM protein [Candidatus Omnitrophota bacterium]